jgi:hypothetical protein
VSSGTGLCDESVTRLRSPAECGTSEYDLETSTMNLDSLELTSNGKKKKPSRIRNLYINFYMNNSSSKKLTNNLSISLETIK